MNTGSRNGATKSIRKCQDTIYAGKSYQTSQGIRGMSRHSMETVQKTSLGEALPMVS